MNTDNPLDKHIELYSSRIPTELRDAATETADQMELAGLIAKTVFKDDATPELSVAMYDRMIARLTKHPN